LAPYWIFIIFLLTFGFTNYVFAEPTDVEIDWLIEGQISSVSPENSKVDSSAEKNSIIDEQIDNFSSTENNVSEDVMEDFITGSGYMLGSRELTIDSKEGQLLNQLLIEQRDTNRDNFFHMIKYLDRYSDGYVELAEALLDPVRVQNYQQGGMTRDHNVHSNLEYFLIERGYDLNDLDSIPNNAFSPTKYDAVRAAASAAANSGDGSTDLRELLPNYVAPDSKAMNDEMVRKLSEQTTNVYDSISSSELQISIAQSPDLKNTVSDNLFDDFQFVNTKFDNSKFENTQHVIDSLDGSNNILELNPVFEFPIVLSIAISIVVGLIIFGYFLYRKSQMKILLPPISVTSPINYVENTHNMIKSSQELFDNNSPKYAFEKFSQAIRYYYSHKLKINFDLTANEIMLELEKSNIDNLDDVRKWLQLCSQVEFVKHKSTQKEFISSLNSFSKYIS